MELKPGDVVMLKSGGHSLSVAEVNEEAAECVWMGNEGELHRETLPLSVLERIDPDEDEDEDDDHEDDDDKNDEEEEEEHHKVA
jgi:uncharacterized protein YodC (DUF2158 family)